MLKIHLFAVVTSFLLPHSLAWSQKKTEVSPTEDKKEAVSTITVLTDLKEAKLLAQQQNKPVFLEFMSSTCGHCQAFKKNVISNPAFIEYANKSLVTVIHDYQDLSKLPADEKKNREALMEKLKINSFPTILLISTEGKILLRKSGYNGATAEKIIEALNKATTPPKTP